MVGKYDKTVSARISSRDHNLLKKSGHSVRDAVEFFNREYYNDNKIRGLRVEKEELINKLDDLKRQECIIQLDIERSEKRLANINQTLPEENISYEYDDKVLNAVESVQVLYDKKRESLANVMELDETIFKVKSQNCELSVDEFKKIVEAKII